MIVLLPLADNENRRIPFVDSKVIELKTSECDYPFNHIFFAEIGKMLHFWKINIENFDSICFIQNRRYFKDFDKFQKIDDQIVYLAKSENIGLNLKNQFFSCHNEVKQIFNNILNECDLNKELLNSNNLCPHNIFYSNKLFFDQYCQFLNNHLIKYFDEKYTKKYGAWISERLLHLFAYSNFKVEQKEIIVLPKK